MHKGVFEMMEIGFVHKLNNDSRQMEQGAYSFTSDEMEKLSQVLHFLEYENNRLKVENELLKELLIALKQQKGGE